MRHYNIIKKKQEDLIKELKVKSIKKGRYSDNEFYIYDIITRLLYNLDGNLIGKINDKIIKKYYYKNGLLMTVNYYYKETKNRIIDIYRYDSERRLVSITREGKKIKEYEYMNSEYIENVYEDEKIIFINKYINNLLIESQELYLETPNIINYIYDKNRNLIKEDCKCFTIDYEYKDNKPIHIKRTEKSVGNFFDQDFIIKYIDGKIIEYEILSNSKYCYIFYNNGLLKEIIKYGTYNNIIQKIIYEYEYYK